MARPPDPEVRVALRLRGDFAPAAIARRLALKPTHEFTRGEPRGGGRSGSKHATSAWILDSGVTATSIEPHIESLLDVIEPRATDLADIVASGVAADIDCYWASVGLSGGPWISPDSMTRLGALGLPLVISFYAVEPG